MDRLQCDHSRAWLSWGDLLVVLATLVLILLGLVRHARAEELFIGFPAPPEPEVVVPDCRLPACDPRVCHVLDPWGVDPVWSGRTEALLLWRDAPQGVPLFENIGGGSALNAGDFGSGMAAGPRFTLFRHTGDNGAFEFTFFRVQHFSASETLPTTDGGYVETRPHGIYCCPSDTPLNDVSGTLSSGFQSFELNRRFPTDGRWQWLTGFRWVQWQEQIGLETRTIVFEDVDRYATGTINDLYGWQFGADSILLGLGTPWRLEGIGKAGVYYNNAAQRSEWSTTDSSVEPTSLAVASSTGRVGFVGELGVTGVHDITDWLSVRAGYAIFWLGGLATASNQLDRQELCVSTLPVKGATDTGGSVFVQGITLGLEGRW